MSWIERMLEERLAQAARNGELAAPHLEGKPLAGLDEQRTQGWWADQFVKRELSHERRTETLSAAAAARAAFCRAPTVAALRELVRAANAVIAKANVNLVESDRVDPFDEVDIERRWRALHPTAR